MRMSSLIILKIQKTASAKFMMLRPVKRPIVPPGTKIQKYLLVRKTIGQTAKFLDEDTMAYQLGNGSSCMITEAKQR